MVDKPKKYISLFKVLEGDSFGNSYYGGYNKALDEYESWLKEKCGEELEKVFLKWSQSIGLPSILCDKDSRLHPDIKNGLIEAIRKHLDVDND